MIDTIQLRIHNIKSYKLIYGQFTADLQKKTTFHQGAVEAIDYDTGEAISKERVWQRISAFQDTGKYMPYVVRSDIGRNSSNYSVGARLADLTTDKPFLEIEFSLPKWFFGTNLFQFLTHTPKDSFTQYAYLVKGIKRFLQVSLAQKVDPKDVQIYRIDMCYNQFHESKSEALRYLQAQKEQAQAHYKNRGTTFRPENETSWYATTGRYSFKVYHKGSEFEKNDAKRLAKFYQSSPIGIKERLKGINYNLTELQGIADRVLRYEITCRASLLHELTMYYTFLDLEKKKFWMRDCNLYQYIKKVQRLGGFQKAASAYFQTSRKKDYDVITFFTGRQKKFCLASVFDGRYSPDCVFSESVTFTDIVYRLLFDFFWNKVKFHQVKQGAPESYFRDRIEQYQEELKRKKRLGKFQKVTKTGFATAGNKNTARLITVLKLSLYEDIRNLKNDMPRATYERLVRDVKAMGFEMKNGMIKFKEPGLDYFEYKQVLQPLIKGFQI